MVALVGTLQTVAGIAPARSVLPVLLYGANWSDAFGHPLAMLSHTWSLSVEEQFYLVWPLVLIALLRQASPRRAVIVCASVGAVASVLESCILWARGAGDDRVYYGSDTRAASLLVGCALAAFMYGRMSRAPGRRSVMVAPLLLAGLGLLGAVRGPFGHAMLAPLAATVVAPVVVLILSGGDDGGVFATPALRYIGRRSYALYLWHLPLLYGVELFFGQALMPRLYAVTTAFVLAEISWRWIERPFLGHTTERVPGPSATSRDRHSHALATVPAPEEVHA
jgi:peptidoglycan/LPS O-acetylase OafA/YrhL